MSGGSYDYIYSTLMNECSSRMFDPEMNEMILDLCKVLHRLEWWQSGDSSEKGYREAVAHFKKKYFSGEGREERLKGYIDEQIGAVKTQLYAMLGDIERVKE